jgi:hypothetical protein
LIGLLGFQLISDGKEIVYLDDAWVQILKLGTWSTAFAKLIRSSTQGGNGRCTF